MVSFSVVEQQEMGAERLLGQVVATHASSMYRKTPNWKQNKETFAPHPEKFNWRICRFFIGLSLSLLAFLSEKIISLYVSNIAVANVARCNCNKTKITVLKCHPQ